MFAGTQYSLTVSFDINENKVAFHHHTFSDGNLEKFEKRRRDSIVGVSPLFVRNIKRVGKIRAPVKAVARSRQIGGL